MRAAMSCGSDHRNALRTTQFVCARPVSGHPTARPEAAGDAEHDEDDGAGDQHPGVQPGQHAEQQARADTHRHSSAGGTASPHDGRHYDHPVIVTAPQSLHGKIRVGRNALTVDQRGVCYGVESNGTNGPTERHVTVEVASYDALPPLAALNSGGAK